MSDIFTDEKVRVIPKKKIETKRPSMWHVVILNDDFTPMEFVVFVLLKVFGFEQSKAEAITWQIHLEGKAVAGTYTFEVAETKQGEVMGLARLEEYPLKVELEQAPEV